MGPRRAGILSGPAPIAAQALTVQPGVFGSAKTFAGQLAAIAVRRNLRNRSALFVQSKFKEADMGFGKGALLWLIGIPLPIILLLALFMNR
jgi:hypothetical protein